MTCVLTLSTWGEHHERILHTSSTLLFIVGILFADPYIVLADEGKDGHPQVMEVNGYHITLASENDWAKGENTVVVTLTDHMGMPLRNADIAILIAAKAEEHAEQDADSHGAALEYDSMAGMEKDTPAEDEPAHEEESADPVAMREADDHGIYIAETHLEASGEHEVKVMFHANGEMLQAVFIVEIPGASSKTVVLWSFVAINLGLVVSAGILKKSTPV